MSELCLDENAIAELLDGALDEDAHARALDHIGRCSSCRVLLARAVRLAQDAGGGPPRERALPRGMPRKQLDGIEFRAGHVIAERFGVIRWIGRGSIGDVYEAQDLVLETRIALKVVKPTLRGHAPVTKTLATEVRTARRVSHPNVCRVFDMGTTGVIPFITMAFVDGQSLEARLRSPMSVREALDVLAQTAAGLAAAHQAGVVHRDLKPSNIVIDRAGIAVITDFGLATDVLRENEAKERAGTPAYFSPEQERGELATLRSDIYALGRIAKETLAATEVDGEITGGPSREDIPSEARRIVEQCLNEDPAARPATVVAVHEALVRALRRMEGASGDAGVDDDPTTLHPSPTAAGLGTQPPRRRRLPPFSPNRFIGREREIGQIHDLILAGVRWVTIVGPPGIGKTRLVIEYARRQTAMFAEGGGIAFCDLTGAREADEMYALVSAVLELHQTKAWTDAPTEIGQALAAQGWTLLVLDNLEHLAEAPSAMALRLIELAPRVQLLATSRHVAHTPHEHVYELGPLSPQDRDGCPDDAVELFVDRVRAVRSRYAPSSEDLKVIEEIVDRVDRMPLGIELAAARARILSPPSILERLTKRFDLLGSTEQAGLRRSIDGSWSLLDESQRRALCQCAVFRGGFTLEAAEAVVALGTAARVLDVVQSLCERSLLREVSTGSFAGELRFDMFESIRDYAWEKASRDEREAAAERHAALYRKWAELWTRQVTGKDAPIAVARLSAERANISHAHGRVLGPDPVAATAMALALDVLLARSGPLDSRLRLLDTAVASATETKQLGLLARAMCARGVARNHAGRLEEAARDLEAAQGFAKQCSRQLEAEMLHQAGILFAEAGQLEKATACYEQALALGDVELRTKGKLLNLLGFARLHRGDHAQARSQFLAALDIFEELGDRASIAAVLTNHGNLCIDELDLEEAQSLFERALRTLAILGSPRREAYVRGCLGYLRHMRRDLATAAIAFEQALQLIEGSGDPRVEGFLRSFAAGVLASRGRTKQALATFGRAHALLEPTEDKGLLATLDVLEGLVDASRARRALNRGNREAAEAAYALACVRLERARSEPNIDGVSAASRSADVRLAIRLVEREIRAS